MVYLAYSLKLGSLEGNLLWGDTSMLVRLIYEIVVAALASVAKHYGSDFNCTPKELAKTTKEGTTALDNEAAKAIGFETRAIQANINCLI